MDTTISEQNTEHGYCSTCNTVFNTKTTQRNNYSIQTVHSNYNSYC